MFLFEYARGQQLFAIVVEHWNNSLRDDWPAVECLVNKVHRATAEFNTMFQRLLLRIKTRERRQQAWVNIENAILICREKVCRQEAHVTRKTNEINLKFLQDCY